MEMMERLKKDLHGKEKELNERQQSVSQIFSLSLSFQFLSDIYSRKQNTW